MNLASSPYKRLLLKLSGEILMGTDPFGIQHEACQAVAHSLKHLYDTGKEVGVVIGGGNIFRGVHLKKEGLPSTPADHIGILATIMNGVALQQALLSLGVPAKLISALDCPKIAERYNWEHTMSHLANRDLVIFVGGTGNPYFTTDTAAALRASEIGADILLKATKVDGIFNKDPLKYPDATKYDQITYSQILAENLDVMDATSIALCRTNKVPVFVFNMKHLLNNELPALLTNLKKGTLVSTTRVSSL